MKSPLIPLGWSATTLGELTEKRPICYGVLKPGPNDPAGVPLVRVSDISENYFDPSELIYINRDLDVEFRRSRLRGGEILISIQGTIGRVARYPTDAGQANISRTIAVIDPDNRVDRSFLYWYLRSLGERGVFDTVGSTRSSLNIGALRKVPIPLPPIDEQRRIADILDRADELRAKRRAAIERLENLKQSIFLDMFSDPVRNPMNWPIKTIGELCAVKGGKRLPKGEEYSSVPTPYRYIRVVDLKDGKVDESGLVYLKPDVQRRIARYTVSPSDVIVSIAGSIGEVAYVPASLDGTNLTENAAKLVPKQADEYLPRYLSEFLRLPYAQSQIGAEVGQVTIGKLALFRLEKVRVPVPPLELQRAYIANLAKIDELFGTQSDSSSQLEELFGSLQQRGLAGAL